jgi:enoyl-CoA hydratase/carnithine racemase
MPYEFIVYDKPAEGVARITLNRPESMNAMNQGLIADVYDAADEAANDEDIAVLIYRGEGRAFCAGRDFKEVARFEQEKHDGTVSWRKNTAGRRDWRGWGLQTWLFPKATIAQVHGPALGGGEWLAAYCDITVASEDATLGFPEGRWGILSGGFHHWNWLIGPKATKKYILTGRNISAVDALRLGLVQDVVPRAELEGTVLGIAQDIVANERRAPGFVRANKGAINRNHADLMKAALEFSPIGTQMHGVDDTLRANSAKFHEEFQKTIAEKGMHAGLELMHRGHTSRS